MHRIAASTALVVSLLALSSCVAAPSNSAQRTGFASEADAVAAAEALLPDYIAALGESASLQVDHLAPFEDMISADLMEVSLRSAENGDERTSFLDGDFDYFSVAVTQVELSAEYPTTFVRIRLCLDYRPTRWVNAAGADVTSADRAPWRAMEVAFVDDPDIPGKVLVDDINWWVGYDFCPTPRELGKVKAP